MEYEITQLKRILRKLFPVLLTLVSLTGTSQVDTSKINSVLDLSFDQLLGIKVTTASKKSEKINDAPGTVYVITREDIKKRGYVFLKDVLRDLPGMETIENSFSEQGTLVPVRGVLGNNKIVVLLNGTRVNPPGGEEMMFRRNFNILQAQQIEVLYGLGSTLYGQDAISAVINIITEKPRAKASLDIMARGGMYDGKEGVISFSSKIKSKYDKYVGITASLSYVDDKMSNLAEEYPKWWNTNYLPVTQRTGIRTIPYRFDKGLNGLLLIENDNSSLQIFHREASRSSAEGGYTGILQFVKEAIWHDRTTVISGSNNFKFSDKIILNSSLTYSRYEIDPESRYVYPISETEIFLNDYKYGLGRAFKIEEQLNYDITKRLSIVGGLMLSYYNIIPKATVPGGADPTRDITTQAGAFVYYTRMGDPSSKVELPRAYNVNYKNYAAYAEGQYLFSHKLKTVIGLRVDEDTRFDDIPFSPRIALIYNVNKVFNFKYIFNKGYVAPAPYFGYNVFDNGVQINTYNADLKAEKAISNELGINYSMSDLSISSSFYYNTQENLIVLEDGRVNPENLVQETVYVNPDGTGPRQLTRTANSGKSRSWGIDLSGRYKAGQLSTWASFSYVNFERTLNNIKTGLNNISAVNIRFGFTWEPIKNLCITPSLIFRTTPENVKDATGLDEELKNPYEINAHVSYEPLKRLTFFIDGENITNHKYALKGVIGPTPQEPIRILGGVRYIFK